MKVLVTGNAGFIGFHLAKRLLERGDAVVGFDVVNDYYDPSLKEARLKILEETARKTGGAYQFVRADLAEQRAVDDCFSRHRFDRVIHLAAQAGVRYSIENPRAYVESNIVGFVNVLEACRHHRIPHLTYASTSSVYGANTRLPTTGLRFFTVYGPWGRPDMALFLFTRNILEGKPIQVFNHGNHTRDFTYIDDIVEGVVRASDDIAQPNPGWQSEDPDPATSNAPFRVFNIGNNNQVKLSSYIEALERALGKRAVREFVPLQAGDVPDTYADASEFERSVGYRPATPIDVGVARFVDWYLAFVRKQPA